MLKNKYGDPNTEPIILDNLIVTSEIREALKLPTDIRVYNKIDATKMEVENQIYKCKKKWGIRDVEDIPRSDRSDPKQSRSMSGISVIVRMRNPSSGSLSMESRLISGTSGAWI